ncbi:hypothetical protein [Fulvivirga sp.]|uniref:hypothetical protein n=1 Tax=Fulvivirga sp. TaxID=1931237 RepID=UPI0032EFC889
MKDNFKDFVNNQREDFEVYEIDKDQLWDKIDQNLHPHHYTGWWKMAAAIALIFVISGTLYISLRTPALPQEVIEAENYYSATMADQMRFIKSQKIELDPAILRDLDTLDQEYESLKNDLKDDIDNEEVISAMIETYRVKLEILEQILNEIQGNDTEEDDEVSI